MRAKLERNLEEKVTCLNRFLKRFKKCENCKEDYNRNHTPTNYDCEDYFEVKILVKKVV